MPVNSRISLEDEPSRLWLLLKIASTLNISSNCSGTTYWNIELEVLNHRLQLISYEFQVSGSKCKLEATEATIQKLGLQTWNETIGPAPSWSRNA